MEEGFCLMQLLIWVWSRPVGIFLVILVIFFFIAIINEDTNDEKQYM